LVILYGIYWYFCTYIIKIVCTYFWWENFV
jgi:hypothetical protein